MLSRFLLPKQGEESEDDSVFVVSNNLFADPNSLSKKIGLFWRASDSIRTRLGTLKMLSASSRIESSPP